MKLPLFYNRFSLLSTTDLNSELEHDSTLSPLPPIMPIKPPHIFDAIATSFRPSPPPPFLRIPLELRWSIFDALVASRTTIEIDPSTINPFHALRLTTKSLRSEVIAWAKKRPDIVNNIPFGYYIPSITTFICKIDRDWKTLVRHETLSDSVTTLARGDLRNGVGNENENENGNAESVQKISIEYATREQVWIGFCRTQTKRRVKDMHLKFEIALSEDSQSKSLSMMSDNDLLAALQWAHYFPRGPWARIVLFMNGTLDQLAGMHKEGMFSQVGMVVQVMQKTWFGLETWVEFRNSVWGKEGDVEGSDQGDGNSGGEDEDGGVDSGENTGHGEEVEEAEAGTIDYENQPYPMTVSYWEDQRRNTGRRNSKGVEIWEVGGQVMEFEIKSVEEMRRGPLPFVVKCPVAWDNEMESLEGEGRNAASNVEDDFEVRVAGSGGWEAPVL